MKMLTNHVQLVLKLKTYYSYMINEYVRERPRVLEYFYFLPYDDNEKQEK